MDDKIKVMLVDDHALFRKGLQLLINNSSKYRVVGEAQNGREFINAIEETRPDIVLMDIEMPVMNGIEAAAIASERYPEIPIITLSLYGEEEYYFSMVAHGVKGFLLKSSDISEVYTAIDTILSGSTYFSNELLNNLTNRLKPMDYVGDEEEELLSSREREILVEICRGLSNQEIGDKLFISKRTVDKHRANILFKTGCKNTANLVMFAIKNRLVEI